MKTLPELFENNRRWAARITRTDPAFFEKLSHQQSPMLLWIGCADSRVPANEIVGLLPGELFVHRNVANLVIDSDMNGQSVIQYAVEVLDVRHIIVCGHYGCGGVRAAMENRSHGLVDHWLGPIRQLHRTHQAELDAIADPALRADRLCELNVRQQVAHVAHSPTVRQAWNRQRSLTVHGWIYRLSDGLLKDLGVSLSGPPM